MKELKKLIGVRTIITLALTGGLLYGFIIGKIEPKDFLIYVSMVYTFFFTKTGQEEVKEQIENKRQNDNSVG